MIDFDIEKEEASKLPFFLSYFITDPVEFGDDVDILASNIEKSFDNFDIDMVCFRDKISHNKEELAKVVLYTARKYNIKKVLINSDIELAIKLGFDGVHLTSTQFDKISYAKQQELFTIVSCHNKEEILKAKSLGSDMVTYSPIFYKENKGCPKGIDNLRQITKSYQTNSFGIIALGGIISNSEITKVKTTRCRGFASIRYFKSL